MEEDDDDDFEWATEEVEEEESDAADDEPVDDGKVSDTVESEETPVEDEIVESDPTTTTEAPPEPLAVNPARLLQPGKRYVSSVYFYFDSMYFDWSYHMLLTIFFSYQDGMVRTKSSRLDDSSINIRLYRGNLELSRIQHNGTLQL